MKQWKTTTPNKHEMTTELMFDEIIKLRKEAANLATLCEEIIHEIEFDSHKDTVKQAVEKFKTYKKSLK